MITNPQFINRLGHFLTADCKSAGTPNGLKTQRTERLTNETPNGNKPYSKSK